MAQFFRTKWTNKFIPMVSKGVHGQITVAGQISESTSREREHRPWTAQEALESSWNPRNVSSLWLLQEGTI